VEGTSVREWYRSVYFRLLYPRLNAENIVLAERGLLRRCQMAIKALTWMVQVFPAARVLLCEIVHNAP
jgi:hypothetical protein